MFSSMVPGIRDRWRHFIGAATIPVVAGWFLSLAPAPAHAPVSAHAPVPAHAPLPAHVLAREPAAARTMASAVAPDLTPRLAAAGPAAGASMRRCTATPTPATIIADIPWPQRRYDLTTLSQINDGTGVTVAVLDSGVDANHPQLGAAILTGQDLLDPKGDARTDCVGHGTAVASIIAARPTAGSGPRGLAPGVRILPIVVSERAESDGVVSGDGNIAELAAGIARAVSHRPRPAVINLSIATTADDPAVRAAIQAALDADIVVVAAVGNQHDHGDPAPFPASYPGVVGVGAIGPDGSRWGMSQVGSYVDIVAPGDQIVAAAAGGGHSSFQGTSFAAPFVSATAALIRARWPALSRTEVQRRLLATADPAAGARPSADYGYGVLNPTRALTEVVAPVGAANPAVLTVEPTMSPTAAADPAAMPVRTANSAALAMAVVLLLLAAAVATIATAVPAGRRRGWRPGRVSDPGQGGGSP